VVFGDSKLALASVRTVASIASARQSAKKSQEVSDCGSHAVRGPTPHALHLKLHPGVRTSHVGRTLSVSQPHALQPLAAVHASISNKPELPSATVSAGASAFASGDATSVSARSALCPDSYLLGWSTTGKSDPNAGTKDWNYPFDLCASAYPRELFHGLLHEFVSLVSEPASTGSSGGLDVSTVGPNELELRMNELLMRSDAIGSRFRAHFTDSDPSAAQEKWSIHLSCASRPCAVAVTANRVQDHHANPVYAPKRSTGKELSSSGVASVSSPKMQSDE